jgi:hypothetical protein
MPPLKKQAIVFAVLASIYGLHLIIGSSSHEPSIEIWMRIIGFVGFGVSSVLAYRKYQKTKLAA